MSTEAVVDLRQPLHFVGNALDMARLAKKGWQELPGAIHHGNGTWSFIVRAPRHPRLEDVARVVLGLRVKVAR